MTAKTPAPIRVLVVDDEATARNGLVDLCGHDRELSVVGSCANGADAIEAIRTLAPQLVLLDVQMPHLSGFDVVHAVGAAEMPLVIFVTAYDTFALQAFEVSALDYVLKPFDDDRFFAAIDRAKQSLRDDDARQLGLRLLDLMRFASAPAAQRPQATERLGGDAGGSPPLTRLMIKSAGRMTLLRVEDIDWIEAADYCVRVHTGGRAHMVRDSMTSLEARLPANRFFRAHRSAILNLDRVHEIQTSARGEHVIILRDGTRLLLGRTRRARLEAVLQERL